MNVLTCDQGSTEWLAARVGMITSTKVGDAIAILKRKEGEAACRRRLRYELVCELLTNRSSEHYVSEWMKKGKESEPDARALYEHLNKIEIEQVGFVFHPDSTLRAGCSPDGLIGENGVWEGKCPKITTHVQYLEANTIPDEYLPQCMWHLACCERDFCDFSSFHPLMPKHRKLFTRRLYRNDAVIGQMQQAAKTLQQEVDDILGRIREKNHEEMCAGVLA